MLTDSQADVVAIENLVFRWQPKGPLILDIKQLRIAKGERLFIAGESGSGKSSLLNVIGGLVHLTDGCIRILSQDIATLKAAERDQFRADHIGFIFQQFNLVPYLSVMQNIVLPCQFSALRRQHVKSRGRLSDEASRLLDALNFPAMLKTAAVTRLSVGQQQRVAAARALIGQPQLLIADEPTSALDYSSRERFIELLFEECDRSGTTLVFVSHDTSLMHLFSRSLEMHTLNRTHKEVG